jgi:hypothetical protein
MRSPNLPISTKTGVGMTRMSPWTHGNRVFGFDPKLRRLWIVGQRLHHGASGIAVVSACLAGMLVGRTDPRRGIAWTLAGGAMIAHDWKDRAVWFRRGPQSD